mmetsp:Transcript_33876/g.82136  ORF Transcript_33876/g.82136 Transcript_33876/m.82136 type:complete len:127 (-) Transcript_33876:1967-2347(-)
MGWITAYRKWRTRRQFKLVTDDDEIKAQKSQSVQRFRSQRRNPLNLCKKSHSKKNDSQYLLLQSDTTESWDDSIQDTLPSEMSTYPESLLIAQYGNKDSFLQEHLSFLILQTQPRAVATIYNDTNW